MKRAAALAAFFVCAGAALAAGLDTTPFAYTRTLAGPTGGTLAFEPDSPLLGHAKVGLGDLRIVDAGGSPVPWRPRPTTRPSARTVPALDAGRQGGAAVATFDLGGGGALHDSLALDVPGGGFVSLVTVTGADARAGRRTMLGATKIYDITGARHVRSTVVTFNPTAFRYLFVRAPGVRAVTGATAASGGSKTYVTRPAVSTTSQTTKRTLVTLDLGYPHIPLSGVHVATTTPRYDRDVEILLSADGRHWQPYAYGRISSARGSDVAFGGRAHFVEVAIENGDDPPLAQLRVRAYDRSRALLAEGAHRPPYRLYYGAPGVAPPSYDFARLPLSTLEPIHVASLGREAANAAYRPPGDTRSFTARHDWLVKVVLALAAVVVCAVGLVALRRT